MAGHRESLHWIQFNHSTLSTRRKYNVSMVAEVIYEASVGSEFLNDLSHEAK